MNDPRRCSCPAATIPPWQTRDAPFSPASLIGGVVLLTFGVLVAAIGRVPWVGWAVVAVIIGGFVIAAIIGFAKGHRGRCLLARSIWFALAAPGLPIRIIATLGI